LSAWELEGTQDEKVGISLLQLHEIMNDIMLAGAFIMEETDYDDFLSDFQRMLARAKTFILVSSKLLKALHFISMTLGSSFACSSLDSDVKIL
jgi:hypothetical protein